MTVMQQRDANARAVLNKILEGSVHDAAGIYLVKGIGNRRYVGEAVSCFSRRRDLFLLGLPVRIIKRMPGSSKEERMLAEAQISLQLIAKGRLVVNSFKGDTRGRMFVGPGVEHKVAFWGRNKWGGKWHGFVSAESESSVCGSLPIDGVYHKVANREDFEKCTQCCRVLWKGSLKT